MSATLKQLAEMQEIERQARVERDAALLPEAVAALTDLYDQCVNGISGPSPFCLRRALNVIDKAAAIPTTISRWQREDGATGGTATIIGGSHEDHHQATALETDHKAGGQGQEVGAAAGRRSAQ